MLLIDLEPKSETVRRAIEDNIQTLDDYMVWIVGYHSGYRDRQNEAIDLIRSELQRRNDDK